MNYCAHWLISKTCINTHVLGAPDFHKARLSLESDYHLYLSSSIKRNVITLDGANLEDPLVFLLMIDWVSSAVPPSTNIQRATLKIIVK